MNSPSDVVELAPSAQRSWRWTTTSYGIVCSVLFIASFLPWFSESTKTFNAFSVDGLGSYSDLLLDYDVGWGFVITVALLAAAGFVYRGLHPANPGLKTALTAFAFWAVSLLVIVVTIWRQVLTGTSETYSCANPQFSGGNLLCSSQTLIEVKTLDIEPAFWVVLAGTAVWAGLSIALVVLAWRARMQQTKAGL